MFRSFPPFSISSPLSYFLLFNPYQKKIFLASSFITSSFSLYHVFLIRYYYLSSVISLSCLIQLHVFQSFCQTFLFHSIWNIVPLWYRSLFRFTSTYSAFSISQSCYFGGGGSSLYSILLTHAAILIERFGQTCMTKEQSEMLMLWTIPLLGRCCIGLYVVPYRP